MKREGRPHTQWTRNRLRTSSQRLFLVTEQQLKAELATADIQARLKDAQTQVWLYEQEVRMIKKALKDQGEKTSQRSKHCVPAFAHATQHEVVV
jgi:hypothetical protein